MYLCSYRIPILDLTSSPSGPQNNNNGYEILNPRFSFASEGSADISPTSPPPAKTICSKQTPTRAKSDYLSHDDGTPYVPLLKRLGRAKSDQDQEEEDGFQKDFGGSSSYFAALQSSASAPIAASSGNGIGPQKIDNDAIIDLVSDSDEAPCEDDYESPPTTAARVDSYADSYNDSYADEVPDYGKL